LYAFLFYRDKKVVGVCAHLVPLHASLPCLTSFRTTLFVALSNLSVPLYQVTNQGKLLTTAVLQPTFAQQIHFWNAIYRCLFWH
jgi:hypothetical protein